MSDEVWIAFPDSSNPNFDAEFQVSVVELAMSKGYDINTEIWNQDKPKFLSGDADYEMREDLFFVADYSIQWMNEQLEDKYALEIDERGLVMVELDESQEEE